MIPGGALLFDAKTPHTVVEACENFDDIEIDAV